MDDEKVGNNNLNFEGCSGDHFSADSLPLIDIRLLSQSELRALSHCSSFSTSSTSSSAFLAAPASGYDDLTPKIDRSVFNESAGSRKQTFLRLRLARHPPQPKPPSPQHQIDDSSLEEKSQVASLLRSLFSVDSIQGKAEEDEREDELEENKGDELISFPSNVYQNPNLDSAQNVLAQGISGNEIKRKRGRPRKIWNPSDMESNEGKRVSVFSFTGESSIGFQSVVKTRSNLGTERLNLENREETMGDLSALANTLEDPYGEELRRITVGLETKEELLRFLEQLNGEWVNRGKNKKLVKACDYGGYLPNGWKLMLCIKKKGSNMWLACCRYKSPDGQQFATYKKVFTYLQSLLESQSKNPPISLQSENKTLGQPVMVNGNLLGTSDSKDLRFFDSETKHESARTSNEVVEEAKDAENGVSVPLKPSVVEKDEKKIPEAEFLNGENDMKKRDITVENLVAISNSEVQNGVTVMMIQGLSTTTGEVL